MTAGNQTYCAEPSVTYINVNRYVIQPPEVCMSPIVLKRQRTVQLHSNMPLIQLTCAKDLNRHFSKSEIQMVNKYNKDSPSLSKSKMLSKLACSLERLRSERQDIKAGGHVGKRES